VTGSRGEGAAWPGVMGPVWRGVHGQVRGTGRDAGPRGTAPRTPRALPAGGPADSVLGPSFTPPRGGRWSAGLDLRGSHSGPVLGLVVLGRRGPGAGLHGVARDDVRDDLAGPGLVVLGGRGPGAGLHGIARDDVRDDLAGLGLVVLGR